MLKMSLAQIAGWSTVGAFFLMQSDAVLEGILVVGNVLVVGVGGDTSRGVPSCM